MKLVTYSKDGSVNCGVLKDKGLIDIQSLWPGGDGPRSVKEILRKGPSCLETVRNLAETASDVISPESVKLLAPLPSPGKILALAGNYSEHIEELGSRLGLSNSPRYNTVPRPFLMPSTVVIGPDEVIPWPAYSKEIDYELELGVVIGKRAKCVPPPQALDCVGGYTIVNDVSARSVTFSKGRKSRPWDEFYDWLNGKWADGFLPMGPYLLTADELPEPQNLEISLTVNGRIRQKANTARMIFPIADIISFLSNITTLEPGDIIATGTPAGVGMARGDFLRAGDVIEGTIEKLGALKNTMGAEPAQYYQPLTE